MVDSVVKSVVDVVSAVQETQQIDVAGFTSEFYSGSNWIKHAFESCKRKIIESSGIEDQSNKKRKAFSAGETESSRNHVGVGKENSHPNVATTGSILKKPTGKKEVSLSKSDDKGTAITSVDVMSLKVTELRMHLREKGLDSTGLKKVLQIRLEKALNSEIATNDRDNEESSAVASDQKKSKEWNNQGANEEEVVSDGKKAQILDETNVQHIKEKEVEALIQSGLDTQMKDCSEEKKEEHKGYEIDQDDEKFVKDEDVEMTDSEQVQESDGHDVCDASVSCEISSKHSQKKTFGQKLLKATRKVFSPNKNKNSPLKSKKLQSPDGTFTANKDSSCDSPRSLQEQVDVSHEEPHQPPSNSKSLADTNEDPKPKHSKRASIICNMTVEEIQSAEAKNTNKEASSSDQKDEVAKIVQSTPALSKTNYNSSSSQKLRLMKEARKARLDEIRNKVHTNSKNLTQLASTKTAAASSTTSNQKILDAADRKRAIALQMRQKAAAAAAKQYTNSTVKSDTAVKQHQTFPTPDKPGPRQGQKTQTVQHQSKTVRSPMETYEMSDRGESDSDDSDYEDREPKKKIPKWAQRENLRAALEKQFLDGPGKIDPDEIFPEVSTCDLEAIFDQRKKRYLKRTSSGNWTKDKVTITEKLVYKRNMGFKK